jgi:hypothetical protein
LKCYWVAILIAAIWLFIILYYTRGGLLIGGDQPGFYNGPNGILTAYPNVVVPSIGLILANGNIYVGFYLGLFIGLCINLFALTYLVNTFFVEWRRKITPVILACVFYVFSMFYIYNTFKSVIGIATVSESGLLLFLALAVKLYRFINKTGRFTKLDCVLLGIEIALSSAIPPNSFRIIAVESAIIAGLLVLAIIKQGVLKISNIKIVLNNFLRTLPIIIVVAVACMMYWEWNYFSTFKTNVATSLYAAKSLGLLTINAPYANLINTFRIFGVWAFQTGYCPYNSLFYSNISVTVTSFLWPIVALGMSLLLVKKNNRLKIMSLVSLSLLIIAWDSANNSPAGAINLFAVSHVPLLSSLFPTFFLSSALLPIFYILLSTFVIVQLAELLRSSKRRFFHFHFKKLVKVVIPLLLIVLLLVPDMPFFTGAALGQYFNSNIKGIWIPNDYFEVTNILSSSMQPGNTALLWPSITTYVQTSWGYQGTNSFYNDFFYPSAIITPDSFGSYSLANPTTATEYSTLTSVPITAGNSSSDITSYADFAKLSVQGANYTYFNNALSLDSVNGTGNYVYIAIPFNETLNTSECALFTLQFSAGPQSLIETLLKNQDLWVGIGSSDGDIGWYIPGSTTSSNYTISDNTFTISMVADSPDKPWAASVYNASSVNNIDFCIPAEDLTNSSHLSIALSSLSIKAFFNVIDQSIINLWQQYKVEYVILDSSNVAGALISPEQYSSLLNLLISKGVLVPIFVGKYLQLYKVNYKALS